MPPNSQPNDRKRPIAPCGSAGAVSASASGAAFFLFLRPEALPVLPPGGTAGDPARVRAEHVAAVPAEDPAAGPDASPLAEPDTAFTGKETSGLVRSAGEGFAAASARAASSSGL